MGNSAIKILAIDDNPDNLIILKALISDSFPEAVILTEMSGGKGLETALREDPDIILLDIVMPGMDGFEVCRKIKSNERLNDIPVVFITAQKGDKESRIRAMEVGADAFIAKPVDENELTAQIRAMVKIKWANRERRKEKERLSGILDEKNLELRKTYIATLNLLEDLNRENEARKKNEEALRKTEERLEDIFQTINEGIAYCSITGEVLSINASMERIVGVPKEFFLGKNLIVIAREMLTVKNLKKIIPILKSIINGHNIEEFEVEYKDKILEITAIVNKDKKRMTGVVRDITQRKRAEEALIQSEQRFRSLVENAFDGIYLTNGKYFYFVNEKFCEIVGYSAEELTSPDFNFDITLTEESARVVRERTGQRKTDQKVAGTYELQINTKDGKFKIVEISTVNLGIGNELNVLGIVRDITERRRIESQIIQSERLSALGEMSAGMAHELNQPLNTLSLLFDNIILEAKSGRGVTEEYLIAKSEKIFHNILRIRNLIDHVREFSRSHDGYILNLFNINQSVENALSMVSEQFRIAGIEILKNLDEDLPQIKGNTFKFEQVMLNFISNAKDALLEKKSQVNEPFPMFIKITTRYDRHTIYLEVEDNGIGIRKENIDKILQPFFTTKETGKGTGLGLSISYGLIKEMNGNISIQSKVLTGTTIIATIPLQK